MIMGSFGKVESLLTYILKRSTSDTLPIYFHERLHVLLNRQINNNLMRFLGWGYRRIKQKT